jgi:hypothetical protein
VEASGERKISLSGDFFRNESELLFPGWSRIMVLAHSSGTNISGLKQNSGPSSQFPNRYSNEKKHKQVLRLSPSPACASFLSFRPYLGGDDQAGCTADYQSHYNHEHGQHSLWLVTSWLECTIWKQNGCAIVVKVLLTLFFGGLFPKRQCQQQYVQ